MPATEGGRLLDGVFLRVEEHAHFRTGCAPRNKYTCIAVSYVRPATGIEADPATFDNVTTFTRAPRVVAGEGVGIPPIAPVSAHRVFAVTARGTTGPGIHIGGSVARVLFELFLRGIEFLQDVQPRLAIPLHAVEEERVAAC